MSADPVLTLLLKDRSELVKTTVIFRAEDKKSLSAPQIAVSDPVKIQAIFN